MPREVSLRRFLMCHQGFVCDGCLASALGLSPDEIRRTVWEDEAGVLVLRYRVCDGCGLEREVIGILASA